MKNSYSLSKWRRWTIFWGAFLALAATPLLSAARSSTSVNIVNNSGYEIRNVYLSRVDTDEWSDNQLGSSVIAAGQSFSLSVTCDQQQVKIISEDQEGCFLSTVVSCGENSTWTITNETPRNCGY